MTDFASIGIELDSRPVVEGTRALDALAETSSKVDQRVTAMNTGMNATAAIMRANAEAVKTADDASAKFLSRLQREVDLFGANRAEMERYNAAAAGLSAESQRAAAALGAKIDAMHRDEKAARDAAAAEDQATKAADRFIKSLKDQVATLDMNRTQLLAYRAAQLGVSDAAAPLIKSLEQTGTGAKGASGHMDGFSMSSVGARRELLVLAHELSQGNFQKFGGSMMVLGEQTGAAGLLFSSTGLAILGVVGTLGLLAAGAIKGSLEQKHMNDALIMTGNYAGLTSDSLNALAHSAVEAGGSLGEAKKVATELAGSGKFTGDQIGYITEATVAWEHATGQSVKSIIASFESLAVQSQGNTMRATEVISRATLKLDDTYHFLTESVYEQIRALEKEGDAKGASALATETFARVTKERAEEIVHNLGGIARGWNAVKEAVGAAADALGDWGKKATPATAVKNASFKLDQFDQGLATIGLNPDTVKGSLAEGRMKIVMELTAAVDKLNQADAAAIAQGKAAVAQSEANHAASRIAQDDARLQKKSMTEAQIAVDEYLSDIAKVKAVNPDSALVTDEAVAAHIAAIQKAHTAAQPKARVDQADNTDLQNHLARIQEASNADKEYAEYQMRLADMYHKAGEVGDAEYFKSRKDGLATIYASEQVMYDKEIKALQEHHNSTKEEAEKNRKAIADIQGKQEASSTKYRHDNTVMDEEERLRQKAVESASEDAANKYTSDLQKQLEAIEAATGKRQKSKSAIEEETVALYEQAVANMKLQASAPVEGLHTQADQDAAVRMLSELEKQLDLHKNIAAAWRGYEGAAASRKLADQAIQDWRRAGDSIADSLSSAFGAGGKALGDMFKAYADNSARQLELNKQVGEATKGLADTDPVKIAAMDRAKQQSAMSSIKGYGDMAAAAKGYFKENTAGYRAMEGVEKTYRAFELALSLKTMAEKLGLLTTYTAAVVVGKETETAATVASVGPDVAASMAKGQAAAVAGVAGQAQGDPYTAWVRMAAMAAAMAALGFAVAGGGGADTTAADRQAAQGAGTVLGSSTAKSESISRAIELSASNSSTQINYLSGMLTSLRAIETGIGSFASQIAQTTDIGNPDVHLNTSNGLGKSIASWGMGGIVVGSLLAKIPVLGNLFDKVGTSIFGGKQSVSDSGFTMDKESLASLLATGANARTYADIKTDGGWFRGDKTDTKNTDLGAEANRQFTAIIASMADGIKAAGDLLGVSGDSFNAQLNSFVVDIGKVSLKGLTGDDLQKALESVFSKLGDQMASYAIGGLTQFQKVGEGYLETLVRVASDYAKVDASLQSIGKTFGSIGVESIGARESLIALLGGIDDFQSKTAGFASNFLTKAEQLAPVAKYVDEQMAALGLAAITTREQFKGIVLSLDLTTAAGQKEYAALMDLQEAFAATHAATVDLSKTEQEIADEKKDLQDQLDQLTMTQAQLAAKARYALAEVNRPLYDLIQTAQKLADTSSSLTTFRDAAKSLYDSLSTSSLSILTPEQQEAQLHSQYEAIKAAAMGGDTTAQGKFSEALNAWLTASQKLNSGDSTYQANFAEGQQDAAAAAAWASSQIDAAQAQLAAMNSQTSELQGLNTALNAANTILQTISQNTAPVGGGANPLGTALSALSTGLKAVEKQIEGLRKDQNAQTGDAIAANAEGQQAIVDSVNKGTSKTTTTVEKVTLE